MIGKSLLLNHSPSEWFSLYKKPRLFSREQTGLSGLTGSFPLCYDKEKSSEWMPPEGGMTMLHLAGLWQMFNLALLIGVLALIVLGCIALWKYIRRT